MRCFILLICPQPRHHYILGAIDGDATLLLISKHRQIILIVIEVENMNIKNVWYVLQLAKLYTAGVVGGRSVICTPSEDLPHYHP